MLQQKVTETLYTPNLAQSWAVSTSVSSSTFYVYETVYGNTLEVKALADVGSCSAARRPSISQRHHGLGERLAGPDDP